MNESEQGTSCSSRSLRLLAVDDQALNLALLKEVIALIGYEADTAQSGYAALNLFEQAAYDFVFLDLEMPGLDGLAVHERLRRLPGGLDAHVIALTAHSDDEVRFRCMETGMDDFLSKPYSIQTVRKLIEQVSPYAA